MVYVAIARDNQRTPIEQAGADRSAALLEVRGAAGAGATASIGAADRGHPIASLADLPAGEYWVQPFVNVYTRFPRADGHTVWMHMDQWEGQNWKRSPGNLFGEPTKVRIDPASPTPITLVADKVIPPIEVPADTALVKRIKIQSQILTKWWGHPIFLGATVLLPKDYDAHPDTHYPVNYEEGHFSLSAPGGFGRGGPLEKLWLAADTPRFIYVTLQHPSPYYDDSYGVNSENNGPYGDAIMQELIPAVETKFRVIREPWARMLSGGSTGGWIALAHQIFYPDFYGGTFASCPDSVDFTYHQIVNIYSDPNAYFLDMGWMQIDRPSQRRPDGNIVAMMKDENRYELTVGDHSRSGDQWDIWEATYSPAGTGWLSQTFVEQADRGHRQERGRAVEEVRPPERAEDELVHAGTEGGAQDQRLRRRHGLVLSQRRRREPQRLPVEGGQSEVDRRDRLSAACAALFRAARRRPAQEDDGADRQVRARRSRSQVLEIPVRLRCRALG